MRRSLIIAALAFLLALPLYAQHRGFGASPRAGASRGARHGAVGVRGGVGVRGRVRGGVAFGHSPRVRVFFNSRGFRHRRFFNSYGYPLGYGYYPYSIYPYTAYPYYGLGLQSDLVYAGPTQQSSDYDAEQNTALSNQVSQLQAELDEIRQERALREQQQYTNRAVAPRSAPAAKRSDEPAAPPTVLVFRDGHTLEARNYAVAGRTLWIFSEQRARKIPLADLDLEATRKANDERGVEFAVRNQPPLP